MSMNITSKVYHVLPTDSINRSMGYLKDHTVIILNLLRYPMQNKVIAVVATLVANLAFFFLSFQMMKKGLDYLQKRNKISIHKHINRIPFPIILGGIALIFTSLSIGFYKLLKPNLHPLAYTALCISTVVAGIYQFPEPRTTRH